MAASTKGAAGLRPPSSFVVSFVLALIVETQDMRLVESQDICFVETQEMSRVDMQC